MKRITATILLVAFIATFMFGCSASNGTTTADETKTTATEVATEATIEPTTEEALKEWNLDWDNILTSPNGSQYDIEEDGRVSYSYIMDYDPNRCLLMVGSTSVWLAEETNEGITLNKLSNDELVVDYTVAYDTVYWYTVNRNVWASNWQSKDTKAYLYYENAVGVSPFTDECEGAVVSEEEANWEGYGGLPIYSPYGVDR